MKIQTLVAAVNQDVRTLAERMQMETDAIIVNQCDTFGYETYEYQGHQIQCYSFQERGVGLNRNNALLRADGDICLFSDEDIRYDKGYREKIEQEFRQHPQADVILFNFRVNPQRRTYYNTEFGRVRWYNCGRYPTFCAAIRRKEVIKAGVTFSLLFGGGAPYSNGEDSLFFMDCMRKGLKVYKSPVELGEEIPRESTWFSGYNRKFFYDRGYLYHFLYGRLAVIFGLRFVYTKKKTICQDIPAKQAFAYLKQGIHDAGHKEEECASVTD